jgi:hypothetical protein
MAIRNALVKESKKGSKSWNVKKVPLGVSNTVKTTFQNFGTNFLFLKLFECMLHRQRVQIGSIIRSCHGAKVDGACFRAFCCAS